MRSSFLRVRSCVSSREPLRVSTLVLTSPTWPRTNFFVAHAGATATESARIEASNRDFRMITSPPKRLLASRACRTGEVTATGVNDKVLLPGPNFQPMPPRTGARLERKQVLVPEISHQLAQRPRAVLEFAGYCHLAASPARQVGKGCGVVDGLSRRGQDREPVPRVVHRVRHH